MPRYAATISVFLLACSVPNPSMQGSQTQGTIVHSQVPPIAGQEIFDLPKHAGSEPLVSGSEIGKSGGVLPVSPSVPAQVPAPAPTSVVESENASAPQAINGALLVCRQLTLGIARDPTSSVACRFETNGQHVKTNDLSTAAFRVVSQPITGVTVTLRTLADNKVYDAFVEIKSSSANNTNQASNGLRVEASVNTAAGIITVSNADVKPPVPFDSNSWMENFAKGGSGNDSVLSDEVTGLLWTVEDVARTFADATTVCESKDYYNRSNWRVPKIGEFRTVHANGITGTSADPLFSFLNLDLNAYYYSSDPVPNSNTGSQFIFIFNNGTVASQPGGNTGSVMCVADAT